MYVYFIQSGNAVKIGKAIDPERRVAELQTGSPSTLRILAKFICRSSKHALQMESVLHEYCKCWRLRGEWFDRRRTSALLRSIDEAGGIESWLNLGRNIGQSPEVLLKQRMREERKRREAEAISDRVELPDLDAEYRQIMG